jgi:hypothetical protein
MNKPNYAQYESDLLSGTENISKNTSLSLNESENQMLSLIMKLVPMIAQKNVKIKKLNYHHFQHFLNLVFQIILFLKPSNNNLLIIIFTILGNSSNNNDCRIYIQIFTFSFALRS